MQKALALCMTALLLLAGCLGTEDAEEVIEDLEEIVEDTLEIVGCGDETALNYVANVTNATNDLCVHEESLESTIVDFITIIENGPDMETLDTTVGFSMEMSDVYVDMESCYEWEYWNPDQVDENQPYNGCPDVVEVSIHYMETTVMSPTGFKSTMEHTIDGVTESSEIIISGNEVQFHIKNSTEDYTVRMKHAETFEDAMEMMMSDDEDDDMSDDGTYWEPYYGGYCEWEGNPDDDDKWSCKEDQSDSDWENWWYYCELLDGDWFCTDDYGQSPDYANSADNDRYTNGYDGGDEMDEMADFGEVEVDDYTQYFNPLSATITGFAPDETGFTFSGSLNIDDAPFSYLEIHTDSTFKVLGFTMEDTEDEDIWVEFMMIDSGDTSTDDTIALSALPYILLDMSDDGDGDGDDGGSDDEFMCDNGETIPSDWVNDGYPDCEDGSDESDDGPGEEVFHYYDNCTDEGNYYECWMDEWDYDNDGDYEESHGYNYEDCSQESNGSWMCFAGYDDEEDEEEIAVYYCTPFVAQNSAGFSIFDNSSLDYSMCGMEVSDEMYEFDNSTFTMPTNLIWEDCWMEGNETVCEQGEIYYDVNTTKLWETTHENNYMDCDGDYDNNTSMCTEWIGNITDADGSAFLLVHDYGQLLMIYQYDEVTQSGLVISVDSEDGDMDPEMLFNMFDANEDGEVNASEWADFGNQSEEGLTEDDWNGILMMIEMFDEDNSSGLNLNEFTNMMESMEDEDDMSNEMMFNMFDANDDGEVNASEWADAANQSGEGMTEDDFNGLVMMVEMYDEDNSSGLNFDEFVNMMESMEDDDDDNDGWSFDRELQDCDSDDDAMVSYTELEACINEDLINDGFDYLNASMVGADYAFNMTDMDADGMLNESEFYELNEMLSDSSDGDDDDMDPETMFNMLDGNGDGEVTTSEWSDFSNSTDEPMSEESFEFLSGVMDNYDDDDSGGLDFDEFMTFMDEMEDMEDGDGEDMKMYMVFGVLPFGADVEDLTVDLVMCIGESLEDMQCDDPVHSRALIDIMVSSEEEAMMAIMSEPIVFVDSDESGTLTTGDFVMINNATLDVDLEWNFARLYSSEAGAYTDENPMMSMLPGFTGFIATIGLLGAALIRRE